ncbi:MAG: glutamate-1-semialdehyde 2,1-aminomutase [Oscillospiraceae bacterium]|nr:glutamate-1-semialdehyde 2,1-aminomutase [Oscillospiraceae bacterium]
MNTTRSDELFNRASQLMPGGVNSPVRAFRSVGRSPLFIERAFSDRIVDANGNEFIDYVCSWGPDLFGHAEPHITDAVKSACEKGLTFGACHEGEVILAQKIRKHFPSMELLRLVNSGTEAVMSAVRAARGATGRSKIIKFAGCYHGHSDGLLVKGGSGLLTNSLPDSAGVPRQLTENTLLAAYNDTSSVNELFEQYGDDIAAVIVEPVAANMGVVAPQKGFLSFLREITDKNGSVLIFDEVITGFRISDGGAQKFYDIVPDMTCLGKIVGGGMPLAAYGGRKDIMECIAPLGSVYQAGTLSGNPVAVAAGIAMLENIEQHPQVYDDIDRKTAILEQAAVSSGLNVNRLGSLMTVFFTDKNVTDQNTALTCDTEKYARFFNYLLESGIYTAPSQFEAMFISAAHSDEDIERTADVIRNYVKEQL